MKTRNIEKISKVGNEKRGEGEREVERKETKVIEGEIDRYSENKIIGRERSQERRVFHLT